MPVPVWCTCSKIWDSPLRVIGKMASKGPRSKLDHETRARRQKVSSQIWYCMNPSTVYFSSSSGLVYLAYLTCILPFLWCHASVVWEENEGKTVILCAGSWSSKGASTAKSSLGPCSCWDGVAGKGCLLYYIIIGGLQSFSLKTLLKFIVNLQLFFLFASLNLCMLQEFDSERKWKLSMAKKIAQRANKSIVDQATKGERKQKVWLLCHNIYKLYSWI